MNISTTILEHLNLMGLTGLLFFLGWLFSLAIEKLGVYYPKEVPLWFMRFALKFAHPEKRLREIFGFIFLFNSIAIFWYMLSGILVFLPFLIVFLTGLHIGIIMQEPPPEKLREWLQKHEEGVRPNPRLMFLGGAVMVLELFAFALSMAMGMSAGIQLYHHYSAENISRLFIPRIQLYLSVCLPVLLVSAYLEARAIKSR